MQNGLVIRGVRLLRGDDAAAPPDVDSTVPDNSRLFDVVTDDDGKIAAVSHTASAPDTTASPPPQTTNDAARDTAGPTEVDGEGLLAFPGFADAHLHLDNACILDRCSICHGTLAEAVAETARAKAAFSEEDVYTRARRTLLRAISNGTTLVRAFAEVDPRVGLRAFRALARLRSELAFAVRVQICAFAQEGTTHEPETLALLDQALRDGADVIGGCPYTDPDPDRHIDQIFDLAQRHDVDVDFHLDFDLDPDHTDLPKVIAETLRRGYHGRVAVGHMTNLSAMPPARVDAIAHSLAAARIAVVVLPATDLFLTGRNHDHLVPRGVAPAHRLASAGVVVAVATNNVLNPFTPFGDASLLRLANLYANVAQLSSDEDLDLCFRMVSSLPAQIIARDTQPPGVRVGGPANLVLLDCCDSVSAVREVAKVVCGIVNGVKTFDNGRTHFYFPAPSGGG
ncbi:hypothetical protein HK405_009287 [Cladochytrium tenue]|nr:hypothetical protein HK405_009287 [Cladochytrium tenue]